MERLCIIGDIHGRKQLLERVVAANPGYTYVLLGDVIHHKSFFRRYARVSPLRVIEYIMGFGDQMITIMGNNEKYVLERFCYPIELIRKPEAKFTMKVLRQLESKQRLDIVKWMVNLPSHLEIGRYRFAHAFYDDPNVMLFGPGFRWYLPEHDSDFPLDPNYDYFFGHYGRPYFRKNIKILDCTELDAVGVYLTDTAEFKVYV